MLTRTSDNSVMSPAGKILYFSVDRFIETIAGGDCCFLCGCSPNQKKFNQEHVIPKWVLSRFELFSKTITLPNGTDIRYDKYTTPCCEDCNNHLGIVMEKPMSEVVGAGYDAVVDYLSNKNPWAFFVWMNLLFIKTHLKDKSLRLHRDRRQPDDAISTFYSWAELHHVHCVARSPYTGCVLNRTALGSFFLFPAESPPGGESFDYVDLYAAQTVLVRLGDIACVCVLNDSCAAMNFLHEDFKRISGPLSPLQLREWMARAALINIKLKRRPRFVSTFNEQTGECAISADLPEKPELEPWSPAEFGALHYAACKDILALMDNSDIEAIKKHVQDGRYTFLFDDEGRFRTNSMESREMREDASSTEEG